MKVSVPVPQIGRIDTPEDYGVELDLRDGKIRTVRFSMRALKQLKAGGFLREWGDADVAELIWIGLHDEAGNPPEDVTLDQLQALPRVWVQYLSAVLLQAYFHKRLPDAAAAPSQEKKAQTTE